MRTREPDLPEAPPPRCRRSRRTTRLTPSRARLKATLVPLTPPPMMTTSALVMPRLPEDCDTLDRPPGRPYKHRHTPLWTFCHHSWPEPTQWRCNRWQSLDENCS